MDIEELFELIERGEGLHLDLKEELPISNEEIAKDLVCFANTDGGRIIVGVSDSGEIQGIHDPDKVVRRICEADRRCCFQQM